MAKHGKKYLEALNKLDRNKPYHPQEAISLAKQVSYAGFDETNVMWPQWAASFPEERDHFTLGQVYRMNIDSHSWRVIKHDPPGVMCQRSPDGDDPCPWLRQELVDIQ